MKQKTRKCRYCKERFVPASLMLPCCEKLECRAAFMEDHVKKSRAVKEAKARAERKADKVKLEKLKTARDWMKEAQIAFNGFIRARDTGKPCICCGHPLVESAVGGGFDCGHYRSVGSAPHLRFDERNAHGQRKQCNRWGGGRAVDYRIGLIARIGSASVDALESDQTARHYSIEDLKQIKAHYIAKRKELLNGQTS